MAATNETWAGLDAVDFLIVDLDGVVVDAGQSYPRAICDAIALHLQSLTLTPDTPTLSQDDVAQFKTAGSFNDE